MRTKRASFIRFISSNKERKVTVRVSVSAWRFLAPLSRPIAAQSGLKIIPPAARFSLCCYPLPLQNSPWPKRRSFVELVLLHLPDPECRLSPDCVHNLQVDLRHVA